MIGQLAERYPATWGTLPKGLGNKGGSGLYATGAMCGHPLGAFLLFNMLGAPDELPNHFLHWFEDTALPTNEAYLDYRSGDWNPVPYFTSGDHPLNNGPKVKPGTVSCHGAHAKWKAASGAWLQYWGAGRANHDRCRKSTYTVMLKLIHMINEWKAGTLPSGTLDPTVATCKSSGCHAADGYPVSGVGGKMKCTPCHMTTAGITPGHGG